MREYYQKNKEKLREYKKKWARDNPEKRKATNKKYYQKNKEKIIAKDKQWQKDNPEKIYIINKRYRKNNKEKVNEIKRRWYKDNRKRLSKYALNYHYTKERRQKISEAMKGNTNMLGKRHSLEARIKMSEKHKGKMPKNMQRSGKWGNVKSGYFNINGKEMFFRSKWEANYALYLDFLIKQKQIKKWEYESDVFIFEKIKFGTRSYRPDFKVINNDDSIIYYEVKGYMDAKSKTKIKRMAKYYPDIKLIIIDKDIYQDIKNKLGKMLKFYQQQNCMQTKKTLAQK